MLYRDQLYVQVIQNRKVEYAHAQDGKPDRDSFLLCLDPATGKNLWRHIRPTDAISEAQEAYTTPIPCESSSGSGNHRRRWQLCHGT